MKYTYFFLTLFCTFILWPVLSQAQYIVDYKQRGDEYFNRKDYYAAAVYYQRALNLLPDSGKAYFYPYSVNNIKNKKEQKDAESFQYLTYRLGESFRLYKDFKSAEGWYEKALNFDNTNFPLARLWYGVCLRADGKYREAVEQLKLFQASYNLEDDNSKRARQELQSCEFALEQMQYPRLSDIRRLPAPVNADSGSNYAAIQVGDTVYFTSSRAYEGLNAKKHNPFVNKIYKTTVTAKGDFSKPEALQLGADKHMQEAAPSVSARHNRIYFTQWLPADKKRAASSYVIAYSERLSGGILSAPVVLDSVVNVTGFNSKGATVSPDGKYLVFSSDRPGGEGGFDLWFCKLNAAGMPYGEAVNLGTEVNSKGDDIDPYYNYKDSSLVFSSNGRTGIGGFDLFTSAGDFSTNQWSVPENMGYPVNSSKDDIFYFPVNENDNFYTSSDRDSKCCLALYDVQLKTLSITGNVYNQGTNNPLDSVEVILIDSITNKVIDSLKTNPDGSYHFTVKNRRPITVKLVRRHFFTKNVDIPTDVLQKTDSVYHQQTELIAYELNKPVVLPNILYDFDKATLRPQSKTTLDTLAKVLIDNPGMTVRISSHTDSMGTDFYNLDLSERRARACVDYLVMKGVAAGRMEAKGYGETRPTAPNTNPDGSDNLKGRQLNRRTDFTVLKHADEKAIYMQSTTSKVSELHKEKSTSDYKGYNYYLEKK